MNEHFLHYLWQFQYFSKDELLTTDGEQIEVINPGYRNSHSGPDFFNSKLKIGDIEWVGNVEIHIQSSGWIQHKHHEDDAYENVILHVVWNEDKKITRRDGSTLPALQLKNRVDEQLILQFKKLINNPETIPCATSFSGVNSITKLSMLDKTLMHRLESKAKEVSVLLERNNNDWEETCYQMLCRNFGFKVNADPFLQLGKAMPYKNLMKHSDKLIQIEALLFGQAGFLEENSKDEYFQLLKREYSLLEKKFNLGANRLSKAQWKFLRLRPANFPSTRIAQLSSLLYSRKNIFSKVLSAASYKELKEIFSVEQSDYWKLHYQFFKPVGEIVPAIGEMSISNIVINTVVPLLVAYGKAKEGQEYVDRAVEILQDVPAEENSIVRIWSQLELECKSAFYSQALIELHNNFCLKRRCLDCSIGYTILQPVKV